MHRPCRIITLAFLILSLALISSCNTLPSAAKVKHNPDPLWEVELEGVSPEFVEDYIYLWDLLENEYPMLNAAERIAGKDAQEIKERYYFNIRLCTTPEAFLQFVVYPCLGEFEYTGHLTAITPDEYSSRYTPPDELRTLSHVNLYNAQQLLGENTLELYHEAIPHSEANEVDISSGNHAETDNLIFQLYPEESAAYVEILSMKGFADNDNPDYNALAEFFEEIEAAEYENCIIDIRRNGGGSDAYWRYAVVKPNSTVSINETHYGLIMGEICAKYAAMHPLVSVHPIADLPLEQLPELNANDLKKATHFMELNLDNPSAESGAPLFSGKFWLLIGPRVYSASESLAVFCKETGFATIVGEPSGGDGVGINPMISVLPNTGICLQFSSIYGLNPDGSCNEEFGTTPDYPIAPGEDALEKCLEIISKK